MPFRENKDSSISFIETPVIFLRKRVATTVAALISISSFEFASIFFSLSTISAK